LNSCRGNIALFLVFLSIQTIGFLAQTDPGGTIAGRVVNAETGEPLENVNVFLSFTTIGTSTDSIGVFTLTGVPVGEYDLIASRVGYERQVIAARFLRTDSLHYDIRLKPRVLQTAEVEVTAERDDVWKDNLERFVKAFIGETEHAGQCRILNPEVLSFRYRNDTLIASSDSLLHIENAAIGYRLHLVLASFVWNIAHDNGRYLIYPRFETLISRSANEKSDWKENRKHSYDGSLKHFLHALYSGRTEEEVFGIYSGSLVKLVSGQGHRVSPGEFTLDPMPGTPFKIFRFTGYLRVEYGRRIGEYMEGTPGWGKASGWGNISKEFADNPAKVSIITLRNAYALIDSLGNLINPLSVEVVGAWAKERVAEVQPMY
jgi:hypothetical protein